MWASYYTQTIAQLNSKGFEKATVRFIDVVASARRVAQGQWELERKWLQHYFFSSTAYLGRGMPEPDRPQAAVAVLTSAPEELIRPTVREDDSMADLGRWMSNGGAQSFYSGAGMPAQHQMAALAAAQHQMAAMSMGAQQQAQQMQQWQALQDEVQTLRELPWRTLGTAALPMETAVRDYWREAGFRVVQLPTRGGYEETTVDYYVVRVSFFGMKQADFDRLLHLMTMSAVSELRRLSAATAERARKRYDASGSKDTRYINLIGGPRDCQEIKTMARELTEEGFGASEVGPGFVSIGMGPLLRATDGNHLSHMPLDPS